MVHEVIQKYRPRGYARLLKFLALLNDRYRYSTINVAGFIIELDLSLNSDIGMFINHGIPNEKGLESILLSLATKDDVFYDVGSNQGYYSFIMATLVSRVVGFEPNVVLYERLVRATSRIEGDFNLSFVNCGLGSERSKLKFYNRLTDHTLGNFRIAKGNEGCQSMDVDVYTLDSLIAEGFAPPSILKIDVEGFEMHVLRGGINTIDKFCPIIFIEWSETFSAEVGFVFKDLKVFFDNENWLIFRIENSGILRSSDLDVPYTTNDLLIVNKNDPR
ncbi:MAG: FkbM family methyltransferase, partial [Bacteroidota bacterium]